jgi:hypothetical protein
MVIDNNNNNNNEKMISNQDDKELMNQYGSLYKESNSDKDSMESEDEEEYEFMMPEGYEVTEHTPYDVPVETAFKVKRSPTNEEVQSCEHQKDWKEERLLDSGSTINLTYRKEHFWNQHESSVTLMAGRGSQVKIQMDGDIILSKEKNSGKEFNNVV